MFLNLEAGQDKILHYALQKPPSERITWFCELRDYLRPRLELEFAVMPSDIKNIMDLIDQTERALCS